MSVHSERWVHDSVPARLADARARMPLLEAAPGQILFRFPTVGRVLVASGEPTRVELFPGGSHLDLDGFLRPTLGAAVAAVHGRFCLQGSAVELDGGAVIFAGLPLLVTSVMAACCATLGCRLLADRVIEIDRRTRSVAGCDEEIWLTPRLARLVGLDRDRSEPIRRGAELLRFRLPSTAGVVPVRHVYWLTRRGPGPSGQAIGLSGSEKVARLTRDCWHAGLLPALGLTVEVFRWAAGLGAGIAMSCATWDGGALPQLAARLLEARA